MPLPPNIENQPGRPKKKRKPEAKDPIEVEADGIKILRKKTQLTVRCGKCKKSGHNIRTCPNKSDCISSSNQVQHIEQIQLQVDEEMMQSVYNDAVMEAYIPDDDPPLTHNQMKHLLKMYKLKNLFRINKLKHALKISKPKQKREL